MKFFYCNSILGYFDVIYTSNRKFVVLIFTISQYILEVLYQILNGFVFQQGDVGQPGLMGLPGKKPRCKNYVSGLNCLEGPSGRQGIKGTEPFVKE